MKIHTPNGTQINLLKKDIQGRSEALDFCREHRSTLFYRDIYLDLESSRIGVTDMYGDIPQGAVKLIPVKREAGMKPCRWLEACIRETLQKLSQGYASYQEALEGSPYSHMSAVCKRF